MAQKQLNDELKKTHFNLLIDTEPKKKKGPVSFYHNNYSTSRLFSPAAVLRKTIYGMIIIIHGGTLIVILRVYDTIIVLSRGQRPFVCLVGCG